MTSKDKTRFNFNNSGMSSAMPSTNMSTERRLNSLNNSLSIGQDGGYSTQLPTQRSPLASMKHGAPKPKNNKKKRAQSRPAFINAISSQYNIDNQARINKMNKHLGICSTTTKSNLADHRRRIHMVSMIDSKPIQPYINLLSLKDFTTREQELGGV